MVRDAPRGLPRVLSADHNHDALVHEPQRLHHRGWDDNAFIIAAKVRTDEPTLIRVKTIIGYGTPS